jgi:hypothetical protein
MATGSTANAAAKRRPRNAAARAAAATAPRAAVARSRVSNGKDILPGIDGRLPAARRYRDLCAALCIDQGGADHMSEARTQLCRRFAGLSVLAESLEAKLVSGATIDVVEYSHLTSTLTRVVARLGINRVARDLTPTLAQYIEQAHAEVSQ